MESLLTFYWDPRSECFTIPFINLAITWYGLFFAGGFWIGLHMFTALFKKFLSRHPLFREGDIHWQYWKSLEPPFDQNRKSIDDVNDRLMKSIEGKATLKKLMDVRLRWETMYPKVFLPIQERAKSFSEGLILYVMIGTVIGARLGHVFFYEDAFYYLTHPWLILNTREGGLASHGGIIGVILSLWFFWQRRHKHFPEITPLVLLDIISIPTMFVCALIRIGNFFNQEILGLPTTLPWGVVFGHPVDGIGGLARHPAQLYESLFYGGVSLFLYLVWKMKGNTLRIGVLSGLGLTFSFAFRFLIEFVKTEQSKLMSDISSFLLMGQWLSLPMMGLGLYLLFYKRKTLRSLEQDLYNISD